ncbi:DUF1634 domain-containing protein [Sphingobacterium sp. Mn56C]|uniref:DUF1634 domain-containing protein n=1 Tax=Sphingobacterium sp. Mn56C TaxID=3395261 RepID=UPI003BE774A9
MKKYASSAYWQDKDIEIIVGNILRIGVVIASITVALGGIIYLLLHGREHIPDYTTFIAEGSNNTSISGIINGVKAFNAPQIIQLGVVFLIATPILRILFSLFGFILERDKMYVFITLIVLAIIVVSIFTK